MLSDQPDVPGPCDRLDGRLRDLLFHLCGNLCHRFGLGEQPGQLLFGEAQQIKPPIGGLKFPEFRREHLFIPPGVLANAVVGQNVSPLLRFAEMVEHDHRNLIQAEFARRQEAPVAGDDPGVGVHQDRVVEPERRDAGGDLRDLFVRVRPGVARERDEPVQPPELNSLGHRGGNLRFHRRYTPHMPAHSEAQFSPRWYWRGSASPRWALSNGTQLRWT